MAADGSRWQPSLLSRQRGHEPQEAKTEGKCPSRNSLILLAKSRVMSLVDHLVQQMQERLLPQEHRFLKQYLVPKKLHACIHKREVSDKVYGTYKTDLSEKREYDTEILRWKTKWQHSPPGKSPATLAETLERANPVLYPNVSAVLSILLTMPVSTATPERSFSSMRRIKTYLLATMKTERLSSFALMQMCREMHDHRRGGCGP